MRFINKLFALSLAACMVFCLTACARSANNNTLQQESSADAADEMIADREQSEESTESPAEFQNGATDVLIAYFSATGNTRNTAEKIAEIIGGTLYEILPAQVYTDEDPDYGNDQSGTSLEMDNPDARPEISSEELVLEMYI